MKHGVVAYTLLHVRGAVLSGIFNAATESGGITAIAGDGAERAVQTGLEAGELHQASDLRSLGSTR